MSKTQRFRAKHIDQHTLANWSVLGITMHHPAGTAVYWHNDNCQTLMKDIGLIRVNEDRSIDLHPFAPATTDDLNVLRGAGMEAAQNEPSKATAWTKHKSKAGVYWTCVISVPLDCNDEVAVAVRCHQAKELTVHESLNRKFRTATATDESMEPI